MTPPDPRKVFIIHGRNLAAREQMGIFTRALGLAPINFDDLRGRMGGTPTIAEIVEKGMSEAQGVIALFTPDEYSVLRPEFRRDHDRPDDVARWQGRPNVLFEAGMAFGRDRKRVVFVLLGNPVLFTDIAGIHVLRPNNDPAADRSVLRRTLQSMGCAIDSDSSEWMQSGDLVSCVSSLEMRSLQDPFDETVDRGQIPEVKTLESSFGSASEEAKELMMGLSEAYLRANYPNHKTWTFNSRPGQEKLFAELRAHRYVETLGAGGREWRLTDLGEREILRALQTSADSVPDLRTTILTTLRRLAGLSPSRQVTSTFGDLAAEVGADWATVYEAMIALRDAGEIDVRIPGGYEARSTFEASLIKR